MAISPNYSWPLPDDTSLVKNGAEAIRDLGNAIDNTVENLPSGALVHIESKDTGGAVSSLSFNDVFTTNFSTFKIVVNLIVTTGDLSLRLRVSGTDFSGSNYLRQRLSLNTSSLIGSRVTEPQFSRVFGRIATGAVTATTLNGELVIQNPAQADLTAFNNMTGQVSGGNTILEIQTGCVQNTTSFDGFTVFPSVGTINGKVAVYAYRF